METLKSNEGIIKVILYFLSAYVALYALIFLVPLFFILLVIKQHMRRKYDETAMPEAESILRAVRSFGTVTKSVLRPDGSERIVLIRPVDSGAERLFCLDPSVPAPKAGQQVVLYELPEPLPQESELPADAARRVLFDTPDRVIYQQAAAARTAKNNYQGMRKAAAICGGIALFFGLLFFGLAIPFL